MSDDVRTDLTELGYSVGVAWGDETVEADALEEAQTAAGDAAIEADVQPIVDRAVELAAADPRLTPADVQGIAARVFTQTLRELRSARDDRVAFHASALEIAEGLPTVYRVSGYGLSLYTDLTEEHVEREEGGRPTDDGGVVHPLVASHKARRFVHVLGQTEPENVGRAETAMGTLRGKGYRLDCDVEDDGSGIAVGILAAGAVVEIAASVDDLELFADTLPDIEEVSP